MTPTVRIQRSLLQWYRANARDLPWRRTQDPYAIWLSEVMLQQTRVETVIPYFDRFLDEFPSVEALAEASEEQVLSLWSGLGYYRRARMLHEGAKAIAGRPFPRTAAGLQQVRGIGRYTAGAVSSIAFGEASPLVDGNVARVVARLFGIEDDLRKPRGMARIWSIAETILVRDEPGAWNQALMDLGATVCTPRAPRCLLCPLASECQARAAGREQELPMMSRKVAPVVQRRVALAVQSDRAEVLLARRSAAGIFAGMWEVPSLELAMGESHNVAADRLAVSVGVTISAPEPCGEVVHVLTHRRLEVAIMRARLLKQRVPALHAEYEAVELMSRDEGALRTKSTYARKLMKMSFPSVPSRR
jgi:A/G-specific adenine glycosylase